MAKAKSKSRKTASSRVEVRPQRKSGNFSYCSMAPLPEREFSSEVTSGRMRLINTFADKWVNGTVLHYYFFDRSTDGETVLLTNGDSRFVSWKGASAQQKVVRDAFKKWESVDIGIKFVEVDDREEAEIRIGFMDGDGAWSYLGRDILNYGPNKRTMNFGWDLTRSGEIDTAIHEIGHTLGFPHEHQNPFAGIVWNEEAVYAYLAQPPNRWDRQRTWWNILRKLQPNSVQGTSWDPDSIMHYPFGPGMIKEPVAHANGISPAGGLSARDRSWALSLYPPLEDQLQLKLVPYESQALQIDEGEQVNLVIEPAATREYDLRTFGASDTVMVLFEDTGDDLRYLDADDDSGTNLNAHLKVRLYKGRRYILRVRLYYKEVAGNTVVMMW